MTGQATTFIRQPGQKWHRAEERQLVGERTGKVFKTYLVNACDGEQPYQPFQAPEVTTDRPTDNICPRCAK